MHSLAWLQQNRLHTTKGVCEFNIMCVYKYPLFFRIVVWGLYNNIILLLFLYVCRSPIWSLPILSEGQLNVGMHSNVIISTPELPPVGQVCPFHNAHSSHVKLDSWPTVYIIVKEPLCKATWKLESSCDQVA
jgi:hypothetical protein